MISTATGAAVRFSSPRTSQTIQLPGVHDQARAAALIGKTAKLELYDLQGDLTGPSRDAQGFPVAQTSIFGLLSSLALAVNLLLLIALLSLLQATLTLPGIAAIALTLGMAIDANVLINERIREELRGGATPQAAIAAGYERAWGTILDSNVTTFIVGLSLLMVPGAVRGFAVVHCLGILTSMFSAVLVSRAIVNLTYGHRRRVHRLHIGDTAWK